MRIIAEPIGNRIKVVAEQNVNGGQFNAIRTDSAVVDENGHLTYASFAGKSITFIKQYFEGDLDGSNVIGRDATSLFSDGVLNIGLYAAGQTVYIRQYGETFYTSDAKLYADQAQASAAEITGKIPFDTITNDQVIKWSAADNAFVAANESGGGGGTVESVNGVTPDGAGNVLIDTDDVSEGVLNFYITQAEKDAIVANTAKRSYPVADENRLANTSGTNTGDQDVSGIATNASAITTLDGEVVKITGDQTVAGVKTFSSSPIVPAPTTDLQAATKKYVDDNAGGGGGYIYSGLKMYGDPFAPASGQTSAGALAGFPTTYNVSINSSASMETFIINVIGGLSTNPARFGIIIDANNYLAVELLGQSVVVKESVGGVITTLGTINAVGTIIPYTNTEVKIFFGRSNNFIAVSGDRYTPSTNIVTNTISSNVTRIGFENGVNANPVLSSTIEEFSSQGNLLSSIT